MSPERHNRIRQMLTARQPDLTVCLEQVHKPHNVSAIIRTADAVGVHTVHAVWSGDKMKTRVAAAAGSHSWTKIDTHTSIEDAISLFKQQNMQVLATSLSENSVDFRDIDFTKPTCIILGQEKTGITVQAVALADKEIVIPMIGMVQSLNVSVASALILYEAQRQRQIAKMYQRNYSLLNKEEQQKLLFEGGYPVLARVAKQKGLPQPFISDEGDVIASEDWWTAMQATRPKSSFNRQDI